MRIEAGRFRGRQLPAAHGARPVPGRLRRSLFGVLAPRIEGARVLDLFAGVGGLGLEALSRGAASVVLVERDGRAAAALARWIEQAGASGEARVVRRDALQGGLPEGPFDLVFADPPFAVWGREQDAARLLRRAVAVLAEDGLLALKLPARQALPAEEGWRTLKLREVGSTAWALLEPSR